MTKEDLDSKVFFKIPKQDLEIIKYRIFIENFLFKWLYEKEGNKKYMRLHGGEWNMEGGIGCCRINGRDIAHCKLYKFDDNDHNWGRGILIRDHYSIADVKKVHLISDSFEKFLKEQKVEYERKNYFLPKFK